MPKKGKKFRNLPKSQKKNHLLGASMLDDPIILGGGKEKDFDHDSVDF